jgi:hypothetical protein
MRNIAHEILREWFRRWYRYATEVRQNPIASAVPYRLKRLAICQDALETVMLRNGIGQEEIEGLRAEVEKKEICEECNGLRKVWTCGLQYNAEMDGPEEGCKSSSGVCDDCCHGILIPCPGRKPPEEGSCIRGPEEMRGCPGPDYITCPQCTDWRPAQDIVHPHKIPKKESKCFGHHAQVSAWLECPACKPSNKIPPGQGIGGTIDEKMDGFSLETRTQGSLHCDIPANPGNRRMAVVDSNAFPKHDGQSLIPPGQSEYEREFRAAMLADQTKLQGRGEGK